MPCFRILARTTSIVVLTGLFLSAIILIGTPKPVGAQTPSPVPSPASFPATTVSPIPTPPATPVGMPPSEMFMRRYRSSAVPHAEPGTLRWRMGVGVSALGPLAFSWPDARPGWYISWSINMTEGYTTPPDPTTINMEAVRYNRLGMEFVPLVRMLGGTLFYPTEILTQVATNNPGRTWIIGNEPDNVWQDNSTAVEYARAYHDAYYAIKAGDPTAQIAFAGLSQITPLRLTYLNHIWDTYQRLYDEPMPVDLWTMHAYVLREEAGNWGVDIPPGYEYITQGVLWDVEDHGDLRLVENQIRLMRSWMARHGQREKPLWITEYGILMPAELGFDEETVQRYMLESFELFRKLRHPRLGMPADDDRLVQRWNWFSTYYEPFPTGDLFDEEGMPKPLMELYSLYLSETEEGEQD